MGCFSKNKLSKKPQYDAVFANNNVINNKLFKILWRYNTLGYARMGVSVAKRNINKAVTRNKFKRISKESFKLNKSFLPSVDIVLIIKKEAGILSSTKLFFDELNKKWVKLATPKDTY